MFRVAKSLNSTANLPGRRSWPHSESSYGIEQVAEKETILLIGTRLPQFALRPKSGMRG